MEMVPGLPGEEVFPSQPMVSQTRAGLEQYTTRGGTYREEVLDGYGHSPHVESPEEFRKLLSGFPAEGSR